MLNLTAPTTLLGAFREGALFGYLTYSLCPEILKKGTINMFGFLILTPEGMKNVSILSLSWTISRLFLEKAMVSIHSIVPENDRLPKEMVQNKIAPMISSCFAGCIAGIFYSHLEQTHDYSLFFTTWKVTLCLMYVELFLKNRLPNEAPI